ncbi:hypothetical protein DKX38_003438 [Salix brachista]|uniref:Autophagy-related protein n=1 Tax=Salix brachista TaxID=2182728 RepID=A0A5N5NPX8_9ROSI|nr:hypothetical protein DKX38_003438 [Salix brachista]
MLSPKNGLSSFAWLASVLECSSPIGCGFKCGLFVGNPCATFKMWNVPEPKGITRTTTVEAEKLKLVSEGCGDEILHQKEVKRDSKDIIGEVYKTHNAIQYPQKQTLYKKIECRTLDKTISNLEMELAAARATQESILSGSPLSEGLKRTGSSGKRRYLMVIGINTAFSSRKRRDSVRATWMPQVKGTENLEEKVPHCRGILDRAIEAEDKKHGDFLRLDHVEGYLELSAKTKIYFATAVTLWDADFYVKVDDDVHVNIATLGETLVRHRKKPRVYIGCMKSGPVLNQKGVRYHEPEYWKFGEAGNKYFRHATGQLYAISKDLAKYISINQHVLHKFANEDVSLGSWFIGLDAEHIDDRRLCCGTPPDPAIITVLLKILSVPMSYISGDCEWKAQAGNICVASFDWSCSGICRSADRIKEVHQRCGEERRQAEAGRIRDKYPDRIPVIVERAEKSDVPDIDKKKLAPHLFIAMNYFTYEPLQVGLIAIDFMIPIGREIIFVTALKEGDVRKDFLEAGLLCVLVYLVPADLTVGQFVYVVRKRIKLSPEKAIFIFVKNILPPTAAMMSAIYEENKDEDGFLYMTYSGENTFGVY